VVLLWIVLPWLCLILSVLLIRSSGYVLYVFLLYVAWMFLGQKFHKNGGHPQGWFRGMIWWKWFADYFPISLHKTVTLDPSANYIFGYHPHGIISVGAFCNFATDATGFKDLFPGIILRLLTLRSNFRIPFFGIYLTFLGICDASPESCHAILKKGPGHSLMLVLGGAKESLDAHPGKFDLTLRDRKGFVKIGLQNGAALVPVLSFGETDVYDQVENPHGSRLREIQEKLQKMMGFAVPLVKGRGVFNYRMGLLPRRRPIRSCVGTPIQLPKIPKDQIQSRDIDEFHQKYIDELQKLFDKFKNQFTDSQANLNIVQ